MYLQYMGVFRSGGENLVRPLENLTIGRYVKFQTF